jgi:hypothetical protein
LVSLAVLGGWFALSYAWDVLLGDDLLSEAPAWALTGAALVLGLGLVISAGFREDRAFGVVNVAAGLAIAGYAVGHRLRRRAP